MDPLPTAKSNEDQQTDPEDNVKCDKSTWTHEHTPPPSHPDSTEEDKVAGPSRDKLSPKLRIKPICQPPRNISPIPEGSKSHDSSLPRQSSMISDSEAVGGGSFRVGLMIAIFSLHWLVSGAIFLCGLILTLMPPSREHACHLYFIIVYLRAAYWVATYIQHEKIKPACQKLINQNYNLYLDMSCYRKAPLQIVSIWNIILLAVQNYAQSLFLARKHGANICGEVNDKDNFHGLHISPQMFIVIFCGLETFTLGCFYIPAIMRLIRSTMPHQDSEDTPNQTLSNLDEIPVNQRLKRQAEQVKILRVAYLKLRHEAATLGALD